jgi:hypothetical protein
MFPTCDVKQELVLERQAVRTKASLFSFKSIRFSVVSAAIYLALSYVLIGFKADQLVLLFIFNTLYFASSTTRRFILGFSVFILYWIVFDYMKAFPNYKYNTVHIASLYHLEKDLFGFFSDGMIRTPNEFFALHHTTFLDILSGFFYLCWIPVPLAFAGILFFRNRPLFFQFSLTFLLVNLIGFIGYYTYPAAPPWYVAQKGFEFISSTPGNTAGLSRFDAFFGVPVFAGIYSKSSNVFAAMPSLHAAYLLVVLYYSIKSKGSRASTILYGGILVGIWFTAIYSGHHYVLDVLAGILCAITGIIAFQYGLRTHIGKKLILRLVRATYR